MYLGAQSSNSEGRNWFAIIDTIIITIQYRVLRFKKDCCYRTVTGLWIGGPDANKLTPLCYRIDTFIPSRDGYNGKRMNGTMKAKILVVDDEADLLAELAPLLERSGYSVTTAADGKQSLILIAQTKPDLVVLDVMMPRMDGREVLRQLRQSGDWTPVILLTRVGSPTERAMSLQEGADDYLNKPFEPLELIARIQAVLRRVDRGSQPLTAFRKLVSGELVIDRQTRQSRLGDRALNLSARAFAVLEFLALHSREVVTRDRLLDQVWGWSEPVGTRTVDTRINELRRALEDDADNPTYIETVIGSGYRFLRRVEGAE